MFSGKIGTLSAEPYISKLCSSCLCWQ